LAASTVETSRKKLFSNLNDSLPSFYCKKKGVGAVLITPKFDRELVILGLERLKDGHSAESTNTAIMKIVNSYGFDKKKLIVIYIIFW
jgi:hypothetical protein